MRCLAFFACLLALALAQDEIGECTTSWADQGSIIKEGLGMAHTVEKFIYPILFGCHASTEWSDDLKAVLKMCFGELLESPDIQYMFISGKLKDFDSILYAVDKLEQCKLRYFGNDTYLDVKKFVEAKIGFEIPDFIEDSDPYKASYECAQNAVGSTSFEKLRNTDKCLISAGVQFCSIKEERAGLVLSLANFIKTADEEPKCTSVKVPDEVTTNIVSCINRATEKMGNLVPDLDMIQNEKNLITMMYLLVNRAFDGIYVEAFNCLPNSFKRNFMNDEMTQLNGTRLAEWVTSFEGWESIPEERDMAYDAVVECGEMISNPELPITHQNGMMLKIFHNKIQYEECLMNKFGKICGINNDFSKKFFFLFNGDMTETLMSAILETIGAPGIILFQIVKETLLS